MNRMRVALLGLGFLPAAVAHAHPGHGVDGGSHRWSHYLSDPVHLTLLVAAGVAVVAVAIVSRKAGERAEA